MKKSLDMEKSDGYFVISLDRNIIQKNIKDFPANHPMLLTVIETEVPPMKNIHLSESGLDFVLIKKELNLVYKSECDINNDIVHNANSYLPEKLIKEEIFENKLNFLYFYNKNNKYNDGTKDAELLSFAKNKEPYDYYKRCLFEKYSNIINKCVVKKLMKKEKEIVLCCIPSHDECGNINNVMAQVIRFISKKVNDNIIDGSNVLYRKKVVTKSSLNIEKRSFSKQYESLSARDIDLIKGKNVLLIDDFYTTGSSMKACKQILLENGANKVYLFSLARTGSWKYE